MGVLLAMLVVVSVLPAGAAGQVTTQGIDQSATAPTELQQNESEGPDPADEIYVQENGDAVLVYDSEDTSSTQTSGQFGVDVSENLAYLLVTEPTTGRSQAEGEMSLLFTGEELSGNGTLSVPQPPTISEFSMDFSGESTAQNAQSTLSIDATANTGRAGQLFQSMTTSGNLTTTASQFVADGQFDADLQAQGMMQSSQTTDFSFSLTESDGGYTVEVDRNESIFEFGESEWDTRTKALETLEQQYSLAASDLDGTAEITLDEYSYTSTSESQARLDIAYTVEYAGLKSQLGDAIAASLQDDPEVDLTAEEAQELGDRIAELEINQVSASYSVDPSAANAQFDVDIANYDQAALAFIEFAQSVETPQAPDDAVFQPLDRTRKQLEAQSAANLRQTYTWNGEVTKPSSTQVAVAFDADYTTANWQAYVSELENRGISLPETTYEFTGSSDGEEITIDGQLSIQGNLLDQTLNYFANVSQNDQEANRFYTAMLQADLQQARMDASVNSSTVVLEGGVQFEDLAALRDALAESEEDFPAGFTSAVGRTEDGGTTQTYVRVQGAVGSGASESDVRALAYVDSDTTVNMPGDWDREFPEMDTDRARDYLGIQEGGSGESGESGESGSESGNGSTNGSGNDTNTSSGIGPGFGVGLAVLAMLASAALLARREQ
jgi:PGF-CTERM protein